MTYRLKTIQYQNRAVQILLQNENGPCPLLAASNCLLLRGAVSLPAVAIRNEVTSLEDIANMLANYAIQFRTTNKMDEKVPSSPTESSIEAASNEAQDQFFLNELMDYIPKFQYGMDVNPKFTVGCQGYEFTAELNILCDMLRCKLVHGWLIDPIQDAPTASAAGTKTYNEMVDRMLAGKDAEEQVSKLQIKIEQLKIQHAKLSDESSASRDVLDNDLETVGSRRNLIELLKQQSVLQLAATECHLIEHFLAESSHQLTSYGLEMLHTAISENELCVFFRNNHFGTITKNDKHLYLLVTDLGYANNPGIVWEKLDVVDGNTEFFSSHFLHNGAAVLRSGSTLTPEQLLALRSQNDADYHLALLLSRPGNVSSSLDERDDQSLAAATEVSLYVNHGLPSNPSFVGKSAAIAVGVPIQPRETGTCTYVPGTDSSRGLMQEAVDCMLAMQLQDQNEAGSATDAASLRLAQQLQQQEDQRTVVAVASVNARQQSLERPRPNPSVAASQKCLIM